MASNDEPTCVPWSNSCPCRHTRNTRNTAFNGKTLETTQVSISSRVDKLQSSYNRRPHGSKSNESVLLNSHGNIMLSKKSKLQKDMGDVHLSSTQVHN